MKPPRKYASAAAFRVALEERLRRLAQEEGLDSTSRASAGRIRPFALPAVRSARCAVAAERRLRNGVASENRPTYARH